MNRDRYATKSERRLNREKPPSIWLVLAVVCFAAVGINHIDCFIMGAFPQTIEFFRPYKMELDELKKRVEALEKKAAK